MTDILETEEAGRRIARGGACRFVAYAFGTLLSLVGIIFVTRALGPADFGRFQALLNLMVVIAAVTDVGLGTLAVREYTQRAGAQRDRYLNVLLSLRVVLTAVGTLLAVAIVALRGDDPVLVFGAFALGLALILNVVQSTVGAPLFTHLRLGLVATIDVGRQALLAGGYVALAVIGAGLAAFLWVSVPVGLAVLVATAVVAWRYYRPRLVVDFAEWRILITTTLGFAFAIAIGTTYQYAAQLLMAATSDPIETGLFSTAFRIFLVLSAISGLFVSAAFPLLARSAQRDEVRFAYGLRVLAESTLILSGALALGMAIGAPFIVEVIGGSEYVGAISATRIFAVQLVLGALVATWGAALLAVHDHRGVIVASVVAIVPVLALTAIVASRAGATGVAILVVAAEVVLVIGYGVFLLPRHSARRPGLRAIGKALIGVVLASSAIFLPLPSLAQAIIAIAIYGIVVVATHALPDEVMEMAPARVGAWYRRS